MKRNLLAWLAVLFGWALPVQDEKPQGMRGAKPIERPASALVVGVNDVVGGVAQPGWPLIVSATLVAADDKQVPVPPDLRLKVTSEGGQELALPFTVVPRPQDADAEQPQPHYWIASEDATRALAPGRYNITLVFDGERKDLRIESADLRVVAPDPERPADPGLLRIQRGLLNDKPDEALAEADRMIGANENDQGAWIARGDILMMQDKPDEALAAYDKALELAEAAEDKHPLAIQQRRRDAFLRTLERGDETTATRPAE